MVVQCFWHVRLGWRRHLREHSAERVRKQLLSHWNLTLFTQLAAHSWVGTAAHILAQLPR
jgi:hypothetical protein